MDMIVVLLSKTFGRVISQRTAMKCVNRPLPENSTGAYCTVYPYLITASSPPFVLLVPCSPCLYKSLHVVDCERRCMIETSASVSLMPQDHVPVLMFNLPRSNSRVSSLDTLEDVEIATHQGKATHCRRRPSALSSMPHPPASILLISPVLSTLFVISPP